MHACVCDWHRKKEKECESPCMCVHTYLCTHFCVSVCVHPHLHLCVCSAMCICMCGTVDQNRALTVAGLLLADACLEELTAARPVNHRACPLALYSHHPILLTLNLAGYCLYTLRVCVCVWQCGDASFTLMCLCVMVLASRVCFRQRSIKTKWWKTGTRKETFGEKSKHLI